jgi:hypothetical protein
LKTINFFSGELQPIGGILYLGQVRKTIKNEKKLNLQKKFSEFHENQIKILLIGFAMKYLG